MFDKIIEVVLSRITATGFVVVEREAIIRVHEAWRNLRDNERCQDAEDELDLAMTHLTLALAKQRVSA